MKLLNFSFTKPRYWVLGLGLAAGTTAAQAQFTGIGTTAPDATLHVVPTDPAHEPLKVVDFSEIPNLTATSTAADTAARDAVRAVYSEVLMYDAASGLFKRESIEELLGDNGEWVYDASTNTLVPRRPNSDLSGGVTFGDTGNPVPLTVNGDVTIEGGVLELGSVTQVTTPDENTQVLIQDPSTGVVQYVTVEDLVEQNGFWQYNGTEDAILPRDAALTDEVLISDGTVAIGNAATIGSTLDVTGATDLASTLDIGTVANLPNSTTATDGPTALDADDRVLVQNANDATDPTRVRSVTVGQLVSDNGEWRYDAGADLIYANRAREASNQIVATTAGDFGIGTATPGAKLHVAGGNVQMDPASSILFGTGSSVASTATTLALTADGQTATLNGAGLGIGTPAVGRLLQTAVQADAVEFGGLVKVTNTNTDINTTQTAATTDDFRNVMLTDDNGVVRVIDVDDLISDSGEWVFEDTNNDDVFDAGEKVYLRRLGNDNSGDDVYVDSEGNMVLDVSKAYQFGSAANQMTSEGITVDGAYAIRNGDAAFAGGLSDFGFYEGASATPWLFHDADPGTTEIGRVGINTDAPAATLHVAGNIVASNTAVTSDRRFKKDISAVSNALEAVKALRGVSYGFRADEFPDEHFDEATHLGFIAQEVEAVLPQAVFERTDGFLTVDYGSITPVLAEAIEELAAKVESLEAENAALRRGTTDQAVGAVSTKQLQDLEARLAEMDARLEAATTGRK